MTQENLEQKTEKGFVRGFGNGMYSGVGRLGAFFYASIDEGESFTENIRDINSDCNNSKNSSSYKKGLYTGSFIGYTLALTAGAMLSGASLVLLSK